MLCRVQLFLEWFSMGCILGHGVSVCLVLLGVAMLQRTFVFLGS